MVRARGGARWLLVLAALVAGAGSTPVRSAQAALPGAGAARCRLRTVAAGDTAEHRPRCPDLLADRCQECDHRGGLNEYAFVVDGENLLIESRDGGSFQLQCGINVTLDNPALPRFEPELPVAHASLEFCPPPTSGGYGAALRRLGVRPLDKLSLHGPTRTKSMVRLQRGDLLGLDLPTLVLERVALADDALVDLTNLTTLYVDGVRPPEEAFASLPRSLLNLHLVRVGTPPDSAMRRLDRLTRLALRDTGPVALHPTWPALADLMLESNASDVGTLLSPALVNLSLVLWAPELPAPWEECAGLEQLVVVSGGARRLPSEFVRRCPRLRRLDLRNMRALTRLEAGALRGAGELRVLRVSDCALEDLPPGLLDEARNLEVVNFSNNHLQSLPNGVFAVTSALHTLDLSRNQLTTPTFQRFSAVSSLRVLRLAHNPALGDACASDPLALAGVSSLRDLRKLKEIVLSYTGATTLCSDWRDLALLETLDLSHNNVTRLACTDLEFFGERPLSLRLTNNPLRRIACTRGDYERALARPSPRARLALPALACDCGVYWAALVLRAAPAVSTSGVRCEGGATLVNTSLDTLLCATVPPPGAERCSAQRRPHWDPASAGAPRDFHVLECAHAGLQRIPPLSPDSLWELRLFNNSIARLASADLPKHLRLLDVRANLLTELDDDTLTTLGNATTLLGENPLACGCEATASLRRLAAIDRSRLDYRALRCGGSGESVDEALTTAGTRCVSRWPLYGTLGALLVAAVLVAGAALSPPVRARLKRALRGQVVLPPPAEGGAWRWDAFVSFSHHDEEKAAALVAGLEAHGGYSACVHSRDWRPGLPIPSQIVESVRASRVTVALVSQHFARSHWTGAEFEEALQRGSLVAVLLEPPDALPAAELRSYLSTNTYLEWSDPYFWRKLTRALGPPLASTVAPAPPSPAPCEAPASPTSPTLKDSDAMPLCKTTADARRGDAALA